VRKRCQAATAGAPADAQRQLDLLKRFIEACLRL
jgi:hypothetical protein